jgi:hypothetical protein
MFFQVYVGTTQVRLVSVNDRRTALAIHNNSANNLYIGARGQNSNGWLIASGGSASFKTPEDDPTEELWAIASGASSDIRVYEGFGKK